MIAIGTFRFDPSRGQLTDAGGALVRLRRKSAQALAVLAETPGQIVAKDTIVARVWDQAVVTDESLSQCISDIRRAIGDTGRGVLETIPGQGFVLHAAMRATAPPGRQPSVLIDTITADGEPAAELAERIAQELMQAMVRRKGVRVRSAGANSPDEKSDFNIRGAVRTKGNTLSVFLQIDEPAGQGVFHSETFEPGDETDADFAARVARKISNIQRVNAIASRGQQLMHVANSDLDLQGLLQKAAFHYARLTPGDTEALIAILGEAVDRHPNDPMALAMLAASNVHMYPLVAIDRSPDRVRYALDLAERAALADPNHDYVLRTRGNLKFWLNSDFEGARADCRRAMAITPNFQLPHLTLLQCDLFEGNIPAAKARMNRQIEVDVVLPQYHYFQTILALYALVEGDIERACFHAREAHEFAAWSDWGVLVLAACYGDRVADYGPAFARRLDDCELDTGHFADLPIRDAAMLKLLSERARAAGIP